MNLEKIVLPILTLTLLYSCSTSTNLPYKDMLRADSDSQNLISDYKYAISLGKEGKTQAACANLSAIENNESFPEQSLVFLKKLEYCESLPRDLAVIWRSNQYLPDWIKSEYIAISLKLAIEHDLAPYIAKFSYESVKYKIHQKDKITLLETAINLAKENEMAQEVKIYQKKLETTAPRYIKRITKDNIYKIARDFERNRDFNKARKLYRVIIKNKRYGVDLIYKSYNRIRLSYKNQRDLKTYINETKKTFLKFQSGPFYKNYKVKIAIIYARAIWTDHKRNQAKKVLVKTLSYKELKNENKALIYWLLGSMKIEEAMEKPNKKEKLNKWAIRLFKKSYSLKPRGESMNDRLRWSIAFTYYLQRNFKKSYKLFSLYKNETKSDAHRSKFFFWEAKSLYSLKEYAQSNQLFKQLGKDDPYSYYGIMAQKEANQAYTPLSKNDPKSKEITAINLPTFEWLLSLDEKTLAIKYLKFKKRNLGKHLNRKNLLPLFHRSESYDNMIHLYFSLKDTDKKRILKTSPMYVYPRPFMKGVVLAEQTTGVDRNLILSISRQESAFNPLARSHADAFGVMQLLPERGRSVSSQHKIPFKDYYDLFKPEKNIMLGAILLSQLQKSFDYKFPLYVASYNASSLAVSRWYKNRYKGDFVQFIEMIPYAETQKYVKLVLRNYFIYKRLNTKEAFLWNPELFNKV